MGLPAFNDPAKLADALALARSFKSGDSSSKHGGRKASKATHKQGGNVNRTSSARSQAGNVKEQRFVNAAPSKGPPPPSQRRYPSATLSTGNNKSSTATGNRGTAPPLGNNAAKKPAAAANVPKAPVPARLSSAPAAVPQATLPPTGSHQKPATHPSLERKAVPVTGNQPSTACKPQETTQARHVASGHGHSRSTHDSVDITPRNSIIDTFLSLIAERLSLENKDDSTVVLAAAPKLDIPVASQGPQPAIKVEKVSPSPEVTPKDMGKLEASYPPAKIESSNSSFPLRPTVTKGSPGVVPRESTQGPTFAERPLMAKDRNSQVQPPVQPPVQQPALAPMSSSNNEKKKPFRGLATSRWA